MTELVLNRGSDLPLVITWPAGPGDDAGPLDLTDYTVSAFEAHPALAPHLTLTVSNAAAGQIAGMIEWDDGMPTGRQMSFRVRISRAGVETTTPAIVLVVR